MNVVSPTFTSPRIYYFLFMKMSGWGVMVLKLKSDSLETREKERRRSEF